MTDLAWRVKLDALIAEANVYANAVAQALIEDADEVTATDAAFEWAERWQVVQDEIQQHMNNTTGGQP